MFIHWALTVASVSSFFLIISFLFCCILFKLISCYSSCRILFCTGYVSYFGCCHTISALLRQMKYIILNIYTITIKITIFLIVVQKPKLFLTQPCDWYKELMCKNNYCGTCPSCLCQQCDREKKSIMLHTCVVTYYFTAQDKTVPHRGQAGLP